MSLECSHCGDTAIESPGGEYYDGQGEWCQHCGYPGQVCVEEDDTAHWVGNDLDALARCRLDDCEECGQRMEPERRRGRPRGVSLCSTS